MSNSEFVSPTPQFLPQKLTVKKTDNPLRCQRFSQTPISPGCHRTSSVDRYERELTRLVERGDGGLFEKPQRLACTVLHPYPHHPQMQGCDDSCAPSPSRAPGQDIRARLRDGLDSRTDRRFPRLFDLEGCRTSSSQRVVVHHHQLRFARPYRLDKALAVHGPPGISPCDPRIQRLQQGLRASYGSVV